MEQLDAFRQKKAKERLDRIERIQKCLQQKRDQSAAVVGTYAVRKPAAGPPAAGPPAVRRPAENLLKDATNRVTSSSVPLAKRQLSARAKLLARRLQKSDRTSGNTDQTSGERRLTLTLSAVPENSESEAEQKHNDDVNNAGQTTAVENVDDTSAAIGSSCRSSLGKR